MPSLITSFFRKWEYLGQLTNKHVRAPRVQKHIRSVMMEDWFRFGPVSRVDHNSPEDSIWAEQHPPRITYSGISDSITASSVYLLHRHRSKVGNALTTTERTWWTSIQGRPDFQATNRTQPGKQVTWSYINLTKTWGHGWGTTTNCLQIHTSKPQISRYTLIRWLSHVIISCRLPRSWNQRK